MFELNLPNGEIEYLHIGFYCHNVDEDEKVIYIQYNDGVEHNDDSFTDEEWENWNKKVRPVFEQGISEWLKKTDSWFNMYANYSVVIDIIN